MTEFDVVLEHAYKTFPGGVRAVIDFNAELKHGEFVALLGPSGCGKTTILRMIGGLEEATEGKIFIAGRDVTDLPPAHRDTSMMFQSFALFPHRTVFQNVEFSLKMKGMEKSARMPASTCASCFPRRVEMGQGEGRCMELGCVSRCGGKTLQGRLSRRLADGPN